jgi:hypothetical protein
MNDKVINIREWKRPRKLDEPYCAIPVEATPTQPRENKTNVHLVKRLFLKRKHPEDDPPSVA